MARVVKGGRSKGRGRKVKEDPKQVALLEKVEAVVANLGIELSYEEVTAGAVRSRGGICRVKDRLLLVVDKRLGTDDRIDILADALRKVDLSHLDLEEEVAVTIYGVGARLAQAEEPVLEDEKDPEADADAAPQEPGE